MKEKKSRFLALALAFLTLAAFIPSAVISVSAADWDLTLPSLAETYKDDFMFGNIMEPNQRTATDITTMFKYHYNFLTAENAMKPSSISNAKGVYTYTNSDALVNWSLSNGISVHGHTLVWHSQSPNWLYRNSSNNPLPRAEAKANMEQFINNVAGHFAGKVVSWDVVNEAFDGGSGTVTDWKTVLRKNSPWYLAYANGADAEKGESPADYIYDAFVFARLADPNATLYYNDYNETDSWKREAMALMAEDLNAKWKTDPRNTDVDRLLVEGLGMQAHYSTSSPSVASVESTIKRFIKAGVEISVTELDMPYGSTSTTAYPTLTKEQQVTQALKYARIFEIFKAYSDKIERVTLWAKNDTQSWRKGGSPVLFDGNNIAKEAYYAVIDPKGYLTEHGQTPATFPRVRTVSVTTPTIVETLAANLYVSAELQDAGDRAVTAYLSVGGELLYPTLLKDGKGKMVIPAAPAADTYDIVVKMDGVTETESCKLKVVDYKPNELWYPQISIDVESGKLLIKFVGLVSPVQTGYRATVGGVAYTASQKGDDSILIDVAYDPVVANSKIVVSGVRYTELFPSYSFTFTIEKE